MLAAAIRSTVRRRLSSDKCFGLSAVAALARIRNPVLYPAELRARTVFSGFGGCVVLSATHFATHLPDYLSRVLYVLTDVVSHGRLDALVTHEEL